MRNKILCCFGALCWAGPLGAAQPCEPSSPPGIARWAIPSDTGRYVGYYVGGGCPRYLRANPPGPDDGTWGWDYQGGFFRRNVILGWWHGRRYQGGTGAYKTDGPMLQRSLERPEQ
jgi:hypothetical protein